MIDSNLKETNTSTLTRQIYRGERGVTSWWNTTAVCDLPGAYGPADLLGLIGLLPAIRRMGFSAILLRLSLPDLNPQRDYIAKLVKATHAAQLKILVRVRSDAATVSPQDSPPPVELDNDPDTLIERTRVLMGAGVDGVDLGLIDDDPARPHREDRIRQFTETVNRQLAEVASLDSTVILTAEASVAHPEFFEHHVQEDWFHHLRDDSLLQAPWDASELRKRVAKAYSSRAPLGQTVAWRPAFNPAAEGADARTPNPGSWADGAPIGRVNAFLTFVSSLPGALYLPFVSAGGQVEVEEGSRPQLRLSLANDPPSRYQHDLTTRILTLRERKHLSHSNLALIDDISWAHPGVSVHLSGHIMVVLNASSEPVAVPAKHLPLLYSDGFVFSDATHTVIQPDTCAWFEPAPANPHNPLAYR